VAISDAERLLASPLESYTRRGPQADGRYFQKLAAEEDIVLFVVGLPVHLDGSESAKSTESRRFGQWLTETTSVPVEFFDERFTSVEAEGFLLEAGLTSKRRKARRDMIAAQILLSAYLESRTKGNAAPGALDDSGGLGGSS
jgi:putative Holliday junction resolvase